MKVTNEYRRVCKAEKKQLNAGFEHVKQMNPMHAGILDWSASGANRCAGYIYADICRTATVTQNQLNVLYSLRSA